MARAMAASSMEEDQLNSFAYAMLLEFWRQVHVWINDGLPDGQIEKNVAEKMAEMSQRWDKHIDEHLRAMPAVDNLGISGYQPSSFKPDRQLVNDYIRMVLQPLFIS
jgi:hypothetical protein